MPLGKSIKKNIKELVSAAKKRPLKQIVAIAYAAAGKSKKPKK